MTPGGNEGGAGEWVRPDAADVVFRRRCNWALLSSLGTTLYVREKEYVYEKSGMQKEAEAAAAAMGSGRVHSR